MNDSTFTRKLKTLVNVQNRACKLLIECEEEYERRYGSNPSDVDDDRWIDNFHGHGFSDPESVSVEAVERGAVLYSGRKPFLKGNPPTP